MTIIAVATLFAIAYWLVFYRAEVQRGMSGFHLISEGLAQDIDGAIEASVQIATQLPSRTMIREELVAYLRGEIDLHDLESSTVPRLMDGVGASIALAGDVRVTTDGTPVAVIGLDASIADRAPRDPSAATIAPWLIVADGAPALCISVPIVDPAYGLAGYDIVAVSFAAIDSILRSAEDVMPGTAVTLLAGSTSEVVRSYPGHSRPSEGALVSTRIALRAPFSIEVTAHERTLTANAHRQRLIVVAAVAVLTAIAVSVNLLVVRGLGRQAQAEANRLNALVEQRTHDLEELVTEKNLLLRELHHRLKNDLAVVQAMLMSDDSPEPRVAISEARARLSTVGRVYDTFQQSESYTAVSLNAVLSNLADDLVVGHNGSGRRVELELALSDVSISGKLAVRLAIVVNELMINAAKYAYEAVDAPRFRIETRMADETNDLVIVASDNGCGAPESITVEGRYGFGLSMVAAVCEQFHASFSIVSDAGTRVTISVPESAWRADAILLSEHERNTIFGARSDTARIDTDRKTHRIRMIPEHHEADSSRFDDGE